MARSPRRIKVYFYLAASYVRKRNLTCTQSESRASWCEDAGRSSPGEQNPLDIPHQRTRPRSSKSLISCPSACSAVMKIWSRPLEGPCGRRGWWWGQWWVPASWWNLRGLMMSVRSGMAIAGLMGLALQSCVGKVSQINGLLDIISVNNFQWWIGFSLRLWLHLKWSAPSTLR